MSAPPDLPAGTTLGRYRIAEPLGAGGMGVVYRAHDPVLERDVALKVPPAADLADPAARAAVLEEARTASRLNHPNICTVYEVGEDAGRVYIAMERIEGDTLDQRIPADGLPGETVVRWGAPLARALAHAHERGVIHRDVKPANIAITPDGRPKLLDFGLSRRVVDAALGRPTVDSDGTLVGVPLYLAPELLRGQPDGPASDVWALGVVLYQMCAGRTPFGPRSEGGLASAILRADPPPLPAHAPPALAALVRRCLAKDPAQRWPGAGELAAALEALAPALAAPVPAAAALRKRNLVVPSLVASLVTLAAVWAWFQWGLVRLPAAADPEALVVLPLEVRGQGDGAEFAGRAFAEALALDLAQDSTLRVAPVPAAEEVRGLARAGRARARGVLELGVGRFVAGTVDRVGDSVRVRVSLVDAQKNRVLWGEERSGAADRLPQLASLVAAALGARLGAVPGPRYDYFMYVTGPPELAAAPEMPEALGAVRRYDAPAALAATARLVAHFPAAPEARVLRAVAMFIDARYEPQGTPKALALAAELDTLRALDPRSPWAEAIAALRLPPGDPQALPRLAALIARPDLTPAARAALYSSRADVYGHSVRDSVAALADAEQAVRLDPASDLALSTLARWLANRGRYAEAAERVRQALALNPTVVNYWHQLGNCMLRLGRGEEYAADLEQAARLSPEGDVLLSALSDGLACAGRWRQAATVAERARRDHDRPRYALQLGVCRMRLGDWKGAARALADACAGGEPGACELRDAAAAVAEGSPAPPSAGGKSGAYALACWHARRGDRAAALAVLERFPAAGWVEPALASDRQFAALRDEPRFRAVVAWTSAQPLDRVFAAWARSR